MPALYSHISRSTGTVLTAEIFNSSHQNHIDNGVPQQLDDFSSSAAQMQSAIDPGEASSESLATSLAGELERLRFAIKDAKAWLQIEPASPQWYSTPTNFVPVAKGGTGSATAAGARTNLGALAAAVTVTQISGNTTLVAGDNRKINVISATAAMTLPAASVLVDGDQFYFKSTTEGGVTIVPAGTDTIDGVNATYRLPSFADCTILRSGAGAFVLLEKPDVSVGDWAWGGYSTGNRGWIKAGSGNKSRTTLAGLFAVYGTTWGTGDGSTTFGIPDGRGRAPIQAGTGVGLTARTLAATAGAETHPLSIAEMPAHGHVQNAHSHAAGTTFTIDSGGGSSPSLRQNDAAGNATSSVTATNQNTGGGGAHNNMQPFFVGELYIKT